MKKQATIAIIIIGNKPIEVIGILFAVARPIIDAAIITIRGILKVLSIVLKVFPIKPNPVFVIKEKVSKNPRSLYFSSAKIKLEYAKIREMIV